VGELLDRLATLHVDEGDLGAAAGTLERWVALDPGEEGARQRLIAAHLERGDGAAARRAWAACRAALADLGVAPSAATETVAARIATFAPARRGSPIGSGRNDPVGLDVSVVPLVGRGRELARLRQAYARAQTAGAQVVVLEGETGSGKTRLATEFLDWARGQDAEVLVGRTFEAEGGLPYAPLAAALRPGGTVVYETFTTAQRAHGRGPTSPDHLLEPGELERAFEGLDVLFYEEVSEPDAVARLVARRLS